MSCGIHRKLRLLFCAVLPLVCFSCRSVKQPAEIAAQLDYSDDVVVRNEIERIDRLMQSEPVEALWHAVLLGDGGKTDECAEIVRLKMKEAAEEKNFLEAERYSASLAAVGIPFVRENGAPQGESDVPGFRPADASKTPKSVRNCIDATVTVWVDRGIAVKNGAGYADRIIGSGFFIDSRGYIITNNHVITDLVDPEYEGFARLYVKLASDPDTRIPAKVTGYDPVLDLALLKVEVEPEFVLQLGSSAELSVGDHVSAIGTPLGLDGTLTSGIISSVDRKLLTLGNVFQIDAAVNSGNSGGPLIDSSMKVQAVVFAGIPRYQGLNFAVPVEYLKQILPFLYAGGETAHAWIGASGRTYRDGPEKGGAVVQYVMPGGTAFMAGMGDGDIITGIQGAEIKSLEDFHFKMMSLQPGTIARMDVLSAGGKKSEIPVYLKKRPLYPAEEIFSSDFVSGSFVPIFGMGLVRSSTLSRKSYTIDRIIRGSAADESGFSENDQISVEDVKFDKDSGYIFAQVYTKRRKKGFLDIIMILASPLDGPYYL